jgi:VWFA-related protein
VLKIISIGALAATILCSISALQSAAQMPKMEGFKFTVQSQLVEVYLTVTKNNQWIPNMKASEFQLAEDGMTVSIDRLDHQDVPLQIALLFDVSESVADNLKYIQEAAKIFIESLNSQDRVMLVFFNSEIYAYPQTTDDRNPILHAIGNARAEGITRLYDALFLGMKHLDGKPGRKAIVCFTDGQDTSGTSSRAAVLNAAAHFGYPIYTIGAGAGFEMDSIKTILRDFAEVNGGKAFFIQDLRKLREAFHEVALELHSAYVLNYYTQIPPDGRWHELSIKSNNPEYEVHARKGFFADPKTAPSH